MDIGLLIIRLVLGTTLAVHGAQKLFGLFGGYGISGTGSFFESIGFRPGKPFAALAGLGEFAGGLALAVGLYTPVAAAVLISTMLVAITVHAEKGFFAQAGGYEYPLILVATAAAVAFTGAGSISGDAVLGHSYAGVTYGLVALALGIVGAIPALAARALGRSRASQAAA
jgi:putative oxidoreductase